MTQNALEIDASRPIITIGVGSVGYSRDITFARANFTNMLLTIKSSEELGILDTDYVQDYDGNDGFFTLKRLSDNLRLSYPCIAVPNETPSIDNDVWRITVPLVGVVNQTYELEGRVRDIIGNHTIFGAVASPIGGEDLTTLTLQVVEGYAIQYVQSTNNASARAAL